MSDNKNKSIASKCKKIVFVTIHFNSLKKYYKYIMYAISYLFIQKNTKNTAAIMLKAELNCENYI